LGRLVCFGRLFGWFGWFGWLDCTFCPVCLVVRHLVVSSSKKILLQPPLYQMLQCVEGLVVSFHCVFAFVLCFLLLLLLSNVGSIGWRSWSSSSPPPLIAVTNQNMSSIYGPDVFETQTKITTPTSYTPVVSQLANPGF
jgi:hypothetical protein